MRHAARQLCVSVQEDRAATTAPTDAQAHVEQARDLLPNIDLGHVKIAVAFDLADAPATS